MGCPRIIQEPFLEVVKSPKGSFFSMEKMDTGAYLYGFQGQEKDDEIKGEGNSLNYTYRMHDPRLGRFFAVDKLVRQYPHWSPYVFSGNIVIMDSEHEGMEPSKGDPNYGGNILITDDFRESTVHSNIRNDNNKNWIAFSPNSMKSTYNGLKAFKTINIEVKINTIYLQGHGAGSTMPVATKKGIAGPPAIDGTPNTTESFTKDKEPLSIGYNDINLYLEVNSAGGINKYLKDNPDDVQTKSWWDSEGKQVEALHGLMGLIEDGGTLIIGACHGGTCDDPDLQGKNLVDALNELSGGKINLILNTGSVGLPEVLDFTPDGVTVSAHQGNWIKIGPETDGKIVNIGTKLILNSQGKPLSTETSPQNNPDEND